MIADQDYSACQSHIGDPSLQPLVESLKAYFAFFYIEPFLVYAGPLEHVQIIFYFYIVSVIKVTGLGWLP